MRRFLPGIISIILMLFVAASCSHENVVYYVSTSQEHNDLVCLLEKEGARVERYSSKEDLLCSVPSGAAVLLLCDGYPLSANRLSSSDLAVIEEKGLRVFAEFADLSDTIPTVKTVDKERVVVVDSLSGGPAVMSLLSVNVAKYIVPQTPAEGEILTLAKVAGLDRAEYGLDDTPTSPLLYRAAPGVMVSTSQLSRFSTVRFIPETRWKQMWEAVLSELTLSNVSFRHWPSTVTPAYSRSARLPRSARRNAVVKGVEWFDKGGFLMEGSREGILEGHLSTILDDGTQIYRNWMRADVQGESAMALSLASQLTGRHEFDTLAANILDYMFRAFRSGVRNCPESNSYGLLGWGDGYEHQYYGDDNARAILGAVASATLMDEHRWDDKLVEAILANYRTAHANGLRDNRPTDEELEKVNLVEYHNDPYWRNTWPHFQSYLLACYIWLYRQSGYEPLLEHAETGIRIIMEAYPDRWYWTNGMEQERARMVLPLAWLYRVQPTDEHRQWLDFMCSELLKNQVECGAIRDEIGGNSRGQWGKIKSNAAYGSGEAPIIFDNGDPISDMLYTNNFAFFGLNEAAKATGDASLAKACDRLADFLVRIQVRSEEYPKVDGAWFRAFNYENWDYWAQDSDSGWGALCTLTGWIQSWITGTLALMEQDTSYWDITASSAIGKDCQDVFDNMLFKWNLQ